MTSKLGDILGFVSSGLNQMGSVMSNYQSYKYSKKLANYEAKLNYKYAQKNAENSPSWQRKGLEEAGFNPMLAIQNGIGSSNSSWASADQFQNQSPVTNALDMMQQNNNNKIAEAQVDNYNADSVLKNNQSITEMYSQLEKLNHSDLMRAQAVLTNKESNNFERAQAREDIRLANEIEQTGNYLKVGMANAIASQVSASANKLQATSIANQKDFETQWSKKHPFLYGISRAGAGAGALVGAGVGSGLGVYGAVSGAVPKTGKVGF